MTGKIELTSHMLFSGLLGVLNSAAVFKLAKIAYIKPWTRTISVARARPRFRPVPVQLRDENDSTNFDEVGFGLNSHHPGRVRVRFRPNGSETDRNMSARGQL